MSHSFAPQIAQQRLSFRNAILAIALSMWDLL